MAAGHKGKRITSNRWQVPRVAIQSTNNNVDIFDGQLVSKPKVASAGLAIYSGLHSNILHTPYKPSTRGQRDGQDPVEPLARDGATSSAKI